MVAGPPPPPGAPTATLTKRFPAESSCNGIGSLLISAGVMELYCPNAVTGLGIIYSLSDKDCIPCGLRHPARCESPPGVRNGNRASKNAHPSLTYEKWRTKTCPL